MRKGTPKPPRPRDVAPVMNALRRHIPMDSPIMCGMRESLKHIPNFRIKGFTNEVPWTVDVYKGDFYYVSVKDTTEIHQTIPSLIRYLWKTLGITSP